jgi:exodeoxyribonuclease V gamma subunit
MREVTLVQLERFFRHPVRYFVNSRLQVYLQEEETEPDEELFALDGIESFDLKWRLVEARLQGLEPSLRQLKAEGSLPHGAFAELALEREAEKVAALSGRLSPYIGVPPRQVAVDLDFGDGPGPRRLSGQVRGIYPGLGLLCWKPGSLKGADVLGLWLAHLAWCATGEDGDKHATLCTSRGDYTIGESLSVDSARGSLARCLDLYWQGVHRPLPVLPKASFAYARKLRDGGKADPMNAARYEWFGNDFNKIPGDKDDPYIRLVVRGLTGHPLEGGEFIELAAALYGEALDSGVLQ